MPREYVELEDCQQTCAHCGEKILAYDGPFFGYLGGNVSYFCNPNDLSRPHEPKAN